MNPFRVSSINSPPVPRVLNGIPAATGDGVVQLRLFDAIDSWGGDWGVSAKEFTAALDQLPESTSEIQLLINSPGGEVYEGIAIMNALRSHPAKVTAIVQGIAASAASFIAASADELVMMQNSELFIHNALAIVMGDAEYLREVAADLEHTDRNIASIYAKKSGKTVDEWLTEMPRDKFLSADEAVASGLADRIEGVAPAEEVEAAVARYRAMIGRPRPLGERARDVREFASNRVPNLPSSSEPGPSNRKGSVVDLDAFLAGIRDRLGVTDAEASLDTLLAALDEALAERADVTVPEGTVMIDADVLASLKADGEAGRQALAAQSKARRESIVDQAVDEGRISNANRDTWLDQLEKDEAGAVKLLATLDVNAHPVREIGVQPMDLSSDEAMMVAAGWGEKDEED